MKEKETSEETATENESSINRGWMAVVGIVAILLFMWLIPSGQSHNAESDVPIIVNNGPVRQTMILTSALSNPITASKTNNISYDIFESGGKYDVCIDGTKWYYSVSKGDDQRTIPAHQSIQCRVSDDSPIKTLVLWYIKVPLY